MPYSWAGMCRHKLVQWTASYLAGAWVALQVIALLGDRFGWSETLFRDRRCFSPEACSRS